MDPLPLGGRDAGKRLFRGRGEGGGGGKGYGADHNGFNAFISRVGSNHSQYQMDHGGQSLALHCMAEEIIKTFQLANPDVLGSLSVPSRGMI